MSSTYRIKTMPKYIVSEKGRVLVDVYITDSTNSFGAG
jgi:hypothetical protein